MRKTKSEIWSDAFAKAREMAKEARNLPGTESEEYENRFFVAEKKRRDAEIARLRRENAVAAKLLEYAPVHCGCGGGAEEIWDYTTGAEMSAVRCACGIKILGQTMAEAVAAWNRAMGAKLREAARALCDNWQDPVDGEAEALDAALREVE